MGPNWPFPNLERTPLLPMSEGRARAVQAAADHHDIERRLHTCCNSANRWRLHLDRVGRAVVRAYVAVVVNPCLHVHVDGIVRAGDLQSQEPMQAASSMTMPMRSSSLQRYVRTGAAVRSQPPYSRVFSEPWKRRVILVIYVVKRARLGSPRDRNSSARGCVPSSSVAPPIRAPTPSPCISEAVR